jgi:hypothetical protein
MKAGPWVYICIGTAMLIAIITVRSMVCHRLARAGQPDGRLRRVGLVRESSLTAALLRGGRSRGIPVAASGRERSPVALHPSGI